jgi:hypothetical protein
MRNILDKIELGFRNKSKQIFEEIYAKDAYVLPGGAKEQIIGNEQIAQTFSNAFGIQTVEFIVKTISEADSLKFITGQYQDRLNETGKIYKTGTFWIVLIKQENDWKVKAHTWSN